MDPVLLKFRNAHTEREFASRFNRRLLLQNDDVTLSIIFVLTVAGTVRLLVTRGFSLCVLGSFVFCVYLFREVRARRRLSVADMIAQRTRRVVFIRVLMVIIHCWWVVTEVGFESNLGLAVLGSTGLFMSSIMAFNLRILFRHHVPCQIFYAMLLLAFATKGSCHTIMTGCESSSIVRLANFLNTLATWVLALLASEFDGTVKVPHMTSPCMHVVFWAHVFVMLVLGSYVLRLMEWRSRLAFIESLPDTQKQQEGLKSVHRLPVWVFFRHAQALVLSFAFLWWASFPLIRKLEKWPLCLD